MKWAKKEGKVEGIQFWDIFGNVTINNMELMPTKDDILDNNDDGDDNSNASDEDSVLNNQEVEEEAKRDKILDEAEENIDGYQELQRNYFNAREEEPDDKLETTLFNDDVNVPETCEINNDNDDISIESDDDDTYKDENSTKPNDDEADVDNKPEENIPSNEANIPRMQKEFVSNLRSYWGDSITGAMMDAKGSAAKLLKDYSQMSASLVTPQYNFMKGMKIFGDTGYDATVKDLEEKLIGRNCITMLDKDDVTNDIKNKALGYLLFLKCKQYGKIKDRGCVDSRPQQDYVTKEESIIPTILLSALMATCLVDALEHRKVMTVDVPGDFFQAGLNEGKDYYAKFTGAMVDMLCESYPECKT